MRSENGLASATGLGYPKALPTDSKCQGRREVFEWEMGVGSTAWFGANRAWKPADKRAFARYV